MRGRKRKENLVIILSKVANPNFRFVRVILVRGLMLKLGFDRPTNEEWDRTMILIRLTRSRNLSRNIPKYY